jgi:hypothetical protein
VKNHDFTPKNLIFFSIAEGGANIFEVFRVKNHDFTPKKKITFFPTLGGGRAPGAHPLNPPLIMLRPFGFLVPKRLLNYLTFIYFDLIKDYSRLSTFLFTILPNMNVNLKPGAAARNKK